MGKIAVIIGAGPAGLTAGLELLRRSDVKPIILEASGEIGGISRTIKYKGNRMDIGGHRFFSKSDRVMQWWMDLMPPEVAASDSSEAAPEIAYQGKRRKVTVPAHLTEEPPLRGLGPLQHEAEEDEDAELTEEEEAITLFSHGLIRKTWHIRCTYDCHTVCNPTHRITVRGGTRAYNEMR